eukprot:gene9991-11710_t
MASSSAVAVAPIAKKNQQALQRGVRNLARKVMMSDVMVRN